MFSLVLLKVCTMKYQLGIWGAMSLINANKLPHTDTDTDKDTDTDTDTQTHTHTHFFVRYK